MSIERWNIEGRNQEHMLYLVSGPTIPAHHQRRVVLESEYESLRSMLAEARRALNPEVRMGDLPMRIDAALNEQ